MKTSPLTSLVVRNPLPPTVIGILPLIVLHTLCYNKRKTAEKAQQTRTERRI